MEWTLEIVLTVLLLATLIQALRLERALGVLKRDRSSMEALVNGFNISTAQVESGIQRLRAAAEGIGRQLDTQITKSIALKEDLAFLTDRAEKMADRLERMVRAARPLAPAEPRSTPSAASSDHDHGGIERELLQTLRMAR
jgi:chromosome segregation ATPase